MRLFYALAGGLLGIVWLLAPAAISGNIPRLHGHVMSLGFVAMLIYGVGLHVPPRFSGHPLYSERPANRQFYAANLGLWLLAAWRGWLALFLFTVRLWPVLWRASGEIRRQDVELQP